MIGLLLRTLTISPLLSGDRPRAPKEWKNHDSRGVLPRAIFSANPGATLLREQPRVVWPNNLAEFGLDGPEKLFKSQRLLEPGTLGAMAPGENSASSSANLPCSRGIRPRSGSAETIVKNTALEFYHQAKKPSRSANTPGLAFYPSGRIPNNSFCASTSGLDPPGAGQVCRGSRILAEAITPNYLRVPGSNQSRCNLNSFSGHLTRT